MWVYSFPVGVTVPNPVYHRRSDDWRIDKMGMDVCGKNPDTEEGEYFRNNVWHWHPLWEYCRHVAPALTEKVIYGHSNDGDGLDAEDSKRLATCLEQRIENGEAAAYVTERDKTFAALPDEFCWLCGGTGMKAGSPKCSRCNGTGRAQPWEIEYSLDVENIENFARFLAHCGGFEIW